MLNQVATCVQSWISCNKTNHYLVSEIFEKYFASPIIILPNPLPSQVAIVTEGMMVGNSHVAAQHYQQVALLATANGTQIAVQVSVDFCFIVAPSSDFQFP